MIASAIRLENLPSFDAAVDFVKKKVGYDEDDSNYIDDLLEELDILDYCQRWPPPKLPE